MKLNFGKNLRRLRLDASLTQEQFAQKIGVSVQSVSRWESSAVPSFPDIELLVIIARFFGVTVDALIGCGEAGPSALEWEELSAIKDSDGKLEYLSEMLRMYPHNHDICHEICELLICGGKALLVNKDAVKKALECAEELIQNSENGFYRSRAIATKGIICPEEELDTHLNKYFPGKEITRGTLLQWRYARQDNTDKYEEVRQKNLLDSIHKFGTVQTYPYEAIRTTEDLLYSMNILIKTFDACSCIETKKPVSGDGEVDLWSGHRIHTGLEMTRQYLILEKQSDARNVLIDTATLLEKLCNTPSGTVLTFRCPMLAGMKSKVVRSCHNGKIIIEAPVPTWDHTYGIRLTPDICTKTVHELSDTLGCREETDTIIQKIDLCPHS